jgi:hypothetical protein
MTQKPEWSRVENSLRTLALEGTASVRYFGESESAAANSRATGCGSAFVRQHRGFTKLVGNKALDGLAEAGLFPPPPL